MASTTFWIAATTTTNTAVADVPDAVRHELDTYGLTAQIGPDNIYASVGAMIAAYGSGPGASPASGDAARPPHDDTGPHSDSGPPDQTGDPTT